MLKVLADKSEVYEAALKSEDLRHKLYQIAHQAQLGEWAIDSMEDRDTHAGLLSLRSTLEEIADTLLALPVVTPSIASRTLRSSLRRCNHDQNQITGGVG